MKKAQYLWIGSVVAVLALGACSTTSEHQTSSAPAERTAAPASESTGSYLVTLEKKSPRLVSVGDEFTYELNARANADVGDVIVSDVVPEGTSYVSSDPPAKRDGNKLSWNLGEMTKGQTASIRLTLKAEREGDLAGCATISAAARVCSTTKVGKPQLAIKKSGPEMGTLGQNVTYTIVVQNTGSTPAKNVVLTDTVPDGLSSASGQKELSFNLGDLEPGAAKSTEVVLRADQRGRVCNKAVASFGGGKVESEACTTIVQAAVKITKVTKDKLTFVNRTASYDIVVANTGDTELTGVVVTDTAAPETVIATAEGASVSGNTATWNVGSLKPGDKQSFAVKILSKVPGTFTDTASVATAQGIRDSAQDSTEWRGVTGVLVELADDPDPIQVGEVSKYTVRVTNQGTSSPISDLKIVATLAPELEVVPNTVSDGGTVDGNVITWPAVPSTPPKAVVTRSYIAKGVKAGDARSKVDVTTSARQNPITQYESTTVY